jgi:hypothetical protein
MYKSHGKHLGNMCPGKRNMFHLKIYELRQQLTVPMLNTEECSKIYVAQATGEFSRKRKKTKSYGRGFRIKKDAGTCK